MPKDILLACQIELEYTQRPEFARLFKYAGLHYEHRINTAGFIFSTQALEDYVAKHRQDPVSIEGGTIGLINYAMDFQRRLGGFTILARLVIPTSKLEVLRNDYHLHRVWFKREVSSF